MCHMVIYNNLIRRHFHFDQINTFFDVHSPAMWMVCFINVSFNNGMNAHTFIRSHTECVWTLIFTDVYEFNLLSFNLNVGHFYRFLLPLLLQLLSQLDPNKTNRHQTQMRSIFFLYGCTSCVRQYAFTFTVVLLKLQLLWWFNKMLKQHVQRQNRLHGKMILNCAVCDFFHSLSLCTAPCLVDAVVVVSFYSFSLTNFRF